MDTGAVYDNYTIPKHMVAKDLLSRIVGLTTTDLPHPHRPHSQAIQATS